MGSLTECVESGAHFLNAFLFTCPIESAITQNIYGSQYLFPETASLADHYYAVTFAASEPGPSPHNTEGQEFMKPTYPDKCYAALGNKSCHGGGARWFFGEYLNQGVEITDAQRAFGQYYRAAYANLMKNGNSDVFTDPRQRTSNWSRLSVENTNESTGRPMYQ